MSKRSFLELDLHIPLHTLRAEVAALPAHVWRPTWWDNVHGSVDIVLLRGGTADAPDDFTTDTVADRPELSALPTTAELIGPDGPFGGCTYAFLFRMAPSGRAHLHEDGHPAWHAPHRIHVPITTSEGAVLVAEGRSCHFTPGRAWTFDNQSLHGFVNGPGERIHLILDAPETPQLRRLLDAARFHPGVPDDVAWAAVTPSESSEPG